ncbi:exodeoxyribonuclease I [Marinihelvus fidelis]|uniref:Exodeoxyribonuclease I n=1 Tax=Marinihelvus fidelis TaxID=2613842 RepID=A0A5N0TFD2_9GAMM|nr:exodeoxyribonuclease I [Marinihelvus fidelis]KAA9133174.1 exodeoxyribonuclease I [Marinihelvus fidelis]
MSFLWHDYETFGTDPAHDRPAQFAAIRTDDELREIGEPVNWFCKPPIDALPHPGASLVTGITPQRAERAGMVEAEFARRIHAEMAEPGTCVAGYNNLRFDDEFTRFMLHRNFIEPYAREYKDGNSRFDLIDVVRMCYALRPDGIEWPEREPGVPSFRLEHLSAANALVHDAPHDALEDVRGTIALAALVRRAQPRLWDWALRLRDKAFCARMLKADPPSPLLLTQSMIPASRGCTTLVLPLADVPERPQQVVVYDLSVDPEPLLTLPADELSRRVFSSAADLGDDEPRIPLMTVACNRLPMVSPVAMLGSFDEDRIGMDSADALANARRIMPHLAEIRSKMRDVFSPPPPAPPGDPDASLYTGGFFSGADRARMAEISRTPAAELGTREWRFDDRRLPEMLFRFRARNFPETLNAEETARWLDDCRRRLTSPPSPKMSGFETFSVELARARDEVGDDPARQRLLDELDQWVDKLSSTLGADKHSTT